LHLAMGMFDRSEHLRRGRPCGMVLSALGVQIDGLTAANDID
jgi:hypothetical protein